MTEQTEKPESAGELTDRKRALIMQYVSMAHDEGRLPLFDEMTELERLVFEAMGGCMADISREVVQEFRRHKNDLVLVNRDGVWASLLAESAYPEEALQADENKWDDPDLQGLAHAAFSRVKEIIRSTVAANLDEYVLTVACEMLTILPNSKTEKEATTAEAA